MHRPRSMLRALALALLAACSGACSGGERAPDVLFVSLDSVRADDLSFRDARAAPAMTRLAERGAVFEQAIAGTSWTLPSHAEMFTGNPPLLHGAQIDTLRIDPLQPTLPELLRARGYHTLGFWTGWYLADEYGFARGFERYQCSMTIDPASNVDLRAALEQRGDSEEAIQSLLRQVASHQDVTSRRVVADARAALAELDELGDERPVFLFAHFYDPHYDYAPPPPYDALFDPDYAGSIDGRGYWDNLAIYDASQSPARRVSERDLEHVRALYRGEIAWVDAAVGGLFELFEERGRLDEALVVITSDHGEEFFEHGNRGHRNHLFDEVLRVPLLIVPPRSAAAPPRAVGAQVTLSDLLPTVLDYAKIEAPETVWGRSLRPWLEGASLPERPAVASLLLRVQSPEHEPQFWLTQALRTPAEKTVRTLSFHDGRPRLRSFVHYDLIGDPGELAPRVDLSFKEAYRLWIALEDGLEPLRAAFARLPHSPAERRSTRARERFAGELGPLGYAESGTEGAEELFPPEPWLLAPPPRLDPPQ